MGSINKIFVGKNKTAAIMQEVKSLIQEKRSMLILDTKEEYLKQFKEELKNNNYEIVILNLCDVQKGNNYNPYYLAEKYYRAGNLDKSVDIIRKITDEFFRFKSVNRDPFWDLAASGLVSGIAYHLLTNHENLNFGEIIKVMSDNQEALKNIFSKKDVLDPANMMAGTAIYSPKDTWGGIVAVAYQKLSYLLAKPLLTKMLSTNEELTLKSHNQAIIIVNNDQPGVENDLARMIIKGITTELYDKKISYNLIFDNYASLEDVTAFDSIFETCCLRGICCYVATDQKEGFTISNFEMIEN